MSRPSAAVAGSYETDVFINCPFDPAFRPIFDAFVFVTFECGFRPRCALEADDSGEVRVEKILSIIRESRFGIHDLSRTELDAATGLPRFNMPLELGMFLAAKRFGSGQQKRKVCLVLDRDRYRYQKFLSDIAGQDIRSHEGDPEQAIREVRDWLRTSTQGRVIPGGSEIIRRYRLFREKLPELCCGLRVGQDELTFADLATLVELFVKTTAN